MGIKMANKKVQTKSQNKLLFCKLCSFVAKDEAELDFHYKMSHEQTDENEVFFEQRIKKFEDGTILIKIPEIGTCIKYPDGRFEC
jgi:hypothetical protein